MIPVVISPADLSDAGPLLLFGYHVAKVMPQAIRHENT